RDLIYAVIVKNVGAYLIATPVVREYCADDRGDLFTLIVNEYSYDCLTEAYTKISGLHIGDVIAVRSLFRRQSLTAAQWTPRPLTSETATQSFFVVETFAVWKRHETSPQPVEEVSTLRQGRKIPLIVFGITSLVYVKPPMLRRQGPGMLFAKVFVPEVQPGLVLRRIQPGAPKAEVLHRTAAVACQWQLGPTLLEFAAGHPDVIRDLNVSPMSFAYGLEPPVATHAQAYAATFGVYALVALQTKRSDVRYYHADIEQVETVPERGTYVWFIIHTEQQTTHSKLWKKGTPLSVELPGGECLRMTITVAEQEPRQMRLGARLQSPTIDLSTIESVVLRQKPTARGDMARLAPRINNIPAVSVENNAMRTLSVISGAGALPALEPFPVNNGNLTLEEYTLSEKQARIIGTLSFNDFTALAVNCGPGTGKTTTLVLSVLSRMENTSTISLMTAMSNSAVTAAVTRLRDVDKTRKCRAVRLISNQNRETVENEHRTPLDFPVLWPNFMHSQVRHFDQHHEPLNQDMVDATIYLCRFGMLICKSLRRADLRNAAKDSPVKDLLPLFFDMYRPHFILGTCASVRSSFGQPGMDRFTDQVELVLLDEASQLPRFAFTAICHTFPKSRPVLIGDVNQLPPFEDPDIPARSSRYAVGNVLRDASAFGRCPMLPLLRVHRCPKAITELLSGIFYEGELTSASPTEDYESVLRAVNLPHAHPVVVMHHKHSHRREDTSLVNEQEVKDAIKYAEGIRSVRRDCSIAILGFYKGSVDYAARRTPRDVSVLTVDSSQGQESSSSWITRRQLFTPISPHFVTRNGHGRRSSHLVSIVDTVNQWRRHSNALRSLTIARGRHTHLDTRQSTHSLIGLSPLAAADSLRTAADHRSTVCHSAPPRSHSQRPTNQDAPADQSAHAGNLPEEPRPLSRLYKAKISLIQSVVSDP
uniref:AAA_12 domain-containing protein n=1 Tax=Caenorhabditis japonica TaxID=281687 RepID=A0A8R1E2M5_CAEJA